MKGEFSKCLQRKGKNWWWTGLVPNYHLKSCNLWINNGLPARFSHISSHIIGSLRRTVVRFGRFTRPEQMRNPRPNLCITEATTAGSGPDRRDALIPHRRTRLKAMCDLSWSTTASFHETGEVGRVRTRSLAKRTSDRGLASSSHDKGSQCFQHARSPAQMGDGLEAATVVLPVKMRGQRIMELVGNLPNVVRGEIDNVRSDE